MTDSEVYIEGESGSDCGSEETCHGASHFGFGDGGEVSAVSGARTEGGPGSSESAGNSRIAAEWGRWRLTARAKERWG